MKNKIVLVVGVLLVGAFASARPFHLCEKKRDKVTKEVCASSSSDEKKKECIKFYKNADCNTVALHEQFEEQ